jgi:Predicted peptidase
MKYKSILILIIAAQMTACQQKDDFETSESDDDIITKVEQFVGISDDTDLANLPTSATYIKEQSLKGKNTSPYGYIVRKPEGFSSDGLKYPILVYLHGAGSRGNSENNPTDINKVDKDGAIRVIKIGLWNPKVAMPVFAPQSSTQWNASNVKSFINYLINTYPML